jgi:hypothetical protein
MLKVESNEIQDKGLRRHINVKGKKRLAAMLRWLSIARVVVYLYKTRLVTTKDGQRLVRA